MSLLSVGIQLIVGSNPTNINQIEICFPHGCCHIFCESAKGITPGVSFHGIDVKTSGRIKIIAQPLEFNNRILSDAFPPVMSYFEPHKRTVSGNNFIEMQRERMKTLILNSNKIIILGIKIRPNDKHIWDYLGQTNAQLVYFGNNQDKNDFDSWLNSIKRNKNDKFIQKYFIDGFEDICTELGL